MEIAYNRSYSLVPWNFIFIFYIVNNRNPPLTDKNDWHKNKAVIWPIVAKSRKISWIFLNSLEFTWIRGVWEMLYGQLDRQSLL